MIAWDPKTLPWDWDTPFPNVWQHGSDMEIPGETLPPQTFLTMNAASADYASNGSFPKSCNMLPKELDCKTPNGRNMAILDLCSSQQEGFPSDMGDCNLAQGRSISMHEGMLIEGQHLNHGSKAYSKNEFFPNQCIMLSKHKELDCKVPKSRNMVNLDLSNDQQEGFRNQLDCKTPSGRNMANLDLCSSQQEGFPSDMGDCNVAQGRSISIQEGMLIKEQHLNHGSNAYSKHGLSPNQCIILSKHKELVCKEPKSRNMVNLDLSNDQGEGPSDVTDCHATGGRVFLKQEGKLREEQHHGHWSEAASGFSGESSICLELGKRTYFVDAPKCGGSKAAPKSVPANPVKKSRLAASGIPCCQVEGCKMELTSAKNYHRRHKVCEMHSKSAVVVVAGQEQRFCQQCSRFHVLLEFDECKRSCRRRLAGHNERRRKPQPDLLTWNRGSPTFQDESHFRHFMTERQCLIHHQGLSNMSSAQETPKESRFMHGNFIWPKVLHFGNESVYDCPIERQGVENNYVPSILSQQMNNRSPILQSQKFMLPMSNGIAGQTSLPCVHNASGPTSRNIVSPSVGTNSCRGFATAAQNSTRVSDSGCALSLLSSQGLCPDVSASVSLNPLAQSIMTLDEWIHNSSFEGQMVQEQQHRMVDQTTDKLMPVTSLSQSICMSSVLFGNGINTHEKEHYAQLFMQDLSSARNLENRGLKEYQGSNSEDVKRTRDLVHLPLLSQNTQMHEPFRTFQLGDGDTVELETLRAYESPIFTCHQML